MDKTDKAISLLLNTKGGNPRCEDIAYNFSHAIDFDCVSLERNQLLLSKPLLVVENPTEIL
jgi:hypothetical protein